MSAGPANQMTSEQMTPTTIAQRLVSQMAARNRSRFFAPTDCPTSASEA